MDKLTIEELCDQYLEGTLLPEDWTALKSYLLKDDNAQLEQELLLALSKKDYGPADPAVLERILKKVTMETTNVAPVHRVHFLRKWGLTAAAVLLVISIATYLWVSDKKDSTNTHVAVVDEIQPGKNGAVLTLADGSTVLLDSAKNGLIAQQGGANARLVDGMLRYEGKGQEEMYNTMSTPKGRQFHLTLPDGTRVWLNSVSSIRYPTAFSGNERKVEITGEAYFEVAKNEALPFAVTMKGGDVVKVLGTHFNIHAYENETSKLVTLLEGSVKVVRNQEAVLLKPTQQAILNNDATSSAIKLASGVNTEQVIAWKNGLFNFSNASLKEVMQQLERWYDIEVVYERNIPDIHFEGEMSKKIPLSGLLTILEKSKVHFRLEGRKLIVTP